MKYFYFNNKIDIKNCQPLIDFINDNEGEITIGFSSIGGSNVVGEFLLKILNDNSERIHLICTGGIYSMGFEIFRRFMGRRSIFSGCVGMTHYSSQEFTLNVSGKGNYEEDRFLLKENRKMAERQVVEVNCFLTRSELNKFKRGDDVYLSFERMKEIFPTVEVI